MKKLAMICLVAVMGLTISCSKDDDGNDKDFVVGLSVTVTGELSNSPMVAYRDKDGTIKTEALTGDWNKSFNVSGQNFDLFLKTTGTIEGEVVIAASGSGSGNDYTNDKNANYPSAPGDFDLTIETRLQ